MRGAQANVSTTLNTFLGRQRTSAFRRCNYHAARMKHTVVYGSARTGDYLIVAIKKSQHVPFQGRHDYRLTTASTNETHRNELVRADGRLSPTYICVTPADHYVINY
jgi:hypothetical protein